MEPNATPEIPQTPVIKKDNHWITILAMALFVLAALSLTGFLYYQNQQLKSMLASYQTQTSPTPTATSDPIADWKTYINDKFSFEFKYPEEAGYLYDQLKQIGDNLLLQNFQDKPGRQASTKDFQISLYVSENKGVKLEDYPKLWEKELGTIPTSKLTVGDETAIKGLSGQKAQAVPTVWFIHDNLVYTIQLSTPNSDDKAWFDQILSTFKFLEQ